MRNDSELAERLADAARRAAVTLSSEDELADMLLDVVAEAGIAPEAIALEQWKRLLVTAARTHRERFAAARCVCC